MAWAQFSPISYKYTRVNPLDLAYLTKDSFLYVPDNVVVSGIIHYPDNMDFDETYVILNPEYAAYSLQHKSYEFTADDFINYQNAHGYQLANVLSTADLQKQRQQNFNKANKILQLFLNKYPELRPVLESAPAYGVFEVTNFNTLIYTGGFGQGMLFDKVKKVTKYVDTLRAGTGFGLGYISNYTLIVFHSHFAVEQYLGVGGVGGDVGVSGTAGVWNRSVSFNPSISIYHIFHYGADIQVNWGGVVYWVSPALN